MPRTDLKHRLLVLEARRPTAEDEEQQRQHAIWRAIITHPDAHNLIRLMDEVAILMEQNGEVCPEAFELLQKVADIMNATEVDPAPERMHR